MDNKTIVRESVYRDLRSQIESDEILAGQRTIEKDIADKNKPPRTGVQEAIKQLEKEGLDVRIAHTGTFVKQYLLEDIIDIYEIRGILEGFAARLLCSRITDEQLHELEKFEQAIDEGRSRKDHLTVRTTDMAFHEFIAKNCGNSRISEITKSLKIQAKSYLLAYEATGGKLFGSVERKYGHEKIINALRKRCPEECERISIMHLKETVDGLLAVLLTDYAVGTYTHKK